MAVGQLPTDDAGNFYPNTAQAQPSMWEQLGSFLGDNKDLLGMAGGAFAKYERQKASNRAQDMINQAAAKWSGFRPDLLGLVKPVEAPNALGIAQEAAIGGPIMWNNIQKIYEAREAAKKGDQSKFDELEKKELQKHQNTVALNK